MPSAEPTRATVEILEIICSSEKENSPKFQEICWWFFNPFQNVKCMKLQTTKYNYTFCILLRGVALYIIGFLKESFNNFFYTQLQKMNWGHLLLLPIFTWKHDNVWLHWFFARCGEFAGFLYRNVVMLNLFNSIAMLNLYDFAQSPEGALWAGGCHHYGNCRRQ